MNEMYLVEYGKVFELCSGSLVYCIIPKTPFSEQILDVFRKTFHLTEMTMEQYEALNEPNPKGAKPE